MKIIDNTPIKDFNEDWGDPDGTGMKAKNLEQVQAFIKNKFLGVTNMLDKFEAHMQDELSRQDSKITEQTDEIDAFKDTITRQVNEYQPIVIEGNVNNAPDEEDITSNDENLLQFKNRSALNGMGYIILRKNKPFAEQLTQTNTIYEIRYDFDLEGETVAIPSGCVLKFDGGALGNGVLLGSSTKLVAPTKIIFNPNISIGGTWNILDIYSQWFADIRSNNCLKKLMAFCSDEICNNVYISGGEYIVSVDANNQSVLTIDKKNTTVNIDGTLTMQANEFPNYCIFEITASNVTIKGAGCLKGDKDSHDYTSIESTHEWGYGIFVNGRQNEEEDHAIYNVRIEGLEICDFSGDCICANHVHNLMIRDVYLHDARRQGISLTDYIRNAVIENFKITNITGTLPKSAIDIEPNYGTARNVTIINGIIGNVRNGVLLYNNSKDSICIADIYIANIEFIEIDGQGTSFACVNSNNTTNLRVENINLTDLPNTNVIFSGGGRVTLNNIRNGIVNLANANISITNMTFDKSLNSAVLVAENSKVIVNQSQIICTKLSTLDNSSTLDVHSSTLTYSDESGVIGANFYRSIIDKTGPLRGQLYDCEVNITSDKLYAFSGTAYRCLFNIELVGENVFAGTNGIAISYISNKTIQDCQITVTATKIYSVFNLDGNSGDKNIRLINNRINIFAQATMLYRIAKVEGCNFHIDNSGLYDIYGGIRPNIQQITDISGKVLPDYGVLGLKFYDTELKKNIMWDGSKWVDIATGYDADFIGKGESEIRPAVTAEDSGFVFFDTTLGKPIWWNGTNWVDATGTTVE